MLRSRQYCVLLGACLLMLCGFGVVRTSKAAEPSTSPLRVALFYSTTCGHCHESEKALKRCEKRWGKRIRVERRKIENIEEFKAMMLYEDHYKSNEDTPPKVFVGTQYLAGDDKIAKRIDKVISEELAKGAVTFATEEEKRRGFGPAATTQPADGEDVPNEILSRFESFSAGAVALAGLLDGINPCAFTTIIFLLSMLAFLGKGRRELVIVGVGFTAAVFGTYFLLGLGFLGAIKTFSVSNGIAKWLTYMVGVGALVLAGWSVLDYVRYRRTGNVKDMTLGLPQNIKQRIHKVIRKGLNTRNLLFGSVGVGVLVSLLESLCTGQVYLPTIVFVARAPGLRGQAIGYLLFYNLMFIAPLVVVLVVAWCGVKSDRLGNLLRKNLGLVKLALAVLFAGLGVLVLATA